MSTPLGTYPQDVLIDYDGACWKRAEPDTISIPEYIERNAGGTIKRLNGCYYRKCEPDDRSHRP
jgi:hypothetical protein